VPVIVIQIRKAASARARWQPVCPETWCGVTHVVLDTPVGIDTTRLHRAMRIADRVIVPLQPSMFDILATQAFLQQLSHYVGQLCMPVLVFCATPRTTCNLPQWGRRSGMWRLHGSNAISPSGKTCCIG
jgi:hypothetical protein